MIHITYCFVFLCPKESTSVTSKLHSRTVSHLSVQNISLSFSLHKYTCIYINKCVYTSSAINIRLNQSKE